MISHKSEMPPGGSEVRRRLRSFIFTPAERPTGSSTQCSRGTRETRLGRMRVGTPGLPVAQKARRFQRGKAMECNVFAVRDDQECDSAQWQSRKHAREQTTGDDQADYTSHFDVFVFVLPSEDFQTCKLAERAEPVVQIQAPSRSQ